MPVENCEANEGLVGVTEPGIVLAEDIKLGLISDRPQDLASFPSVGIKEDEPHYLPPVVDLTNEQSAVKNQLGTNSCTAFATVAALESLAKKNAQRQFYSELFAYFESRAALNLINDEGSTISASIAVLRKEGVCLSETWPPIGTDIKTAVNLHPNPGAYEEAKSYMVMDAHVVEGGDKCIKKLLSTRHPVIIGFEVRENAHDFYLKSKTTGIVQMSSGRVFGGHAVLCVGYDDRTKFWKFKNSWGASWGDHGYGYLPYEYGLIMDRWVILEQRVLPFGLLKWGNIQNDKSIRCRSGVAPETVHSKAVLIYARKAIEDHQRGFGPELTGMLQLSARRKPSESRHLSYDTHHLLFGQPLKRSEIVGLSKEPSGAVDDALDETPTIIIATAWPREFTDEARKHKIDVDNGMGYIHGLCSQQVQSKIDDKSLTENDKLGIAGYYARCKDYYIRNVADTWLVTEKQSTLDKKYEMDARQFHTDLITDVMAGLVLSPGVKTALDGVLNTFAKTIRMAESQRGNFHMTMQIYEWLPEFGMMNVTMRTVFFGTDSSTKEFVSTKSSHTNISFHANLQITDYNFNLNVYEGIREGMAADLVQRGKEQLKKAEQLAGPGLQL